MRSPECREPVRVATLVERLARRLEAFAMLREGSLDRPVGAPLPCRPGECWDGGRPLPDGAVVVCGPEEVSKLTRSDSAGERVRALVSAAPALIVLAAQGAAPEALLRLAGERGIPVATTSSAVAAAASAVTRALAHLQAPRVRVHGVLIDLHGLGVVLLGESGIGKSECALELISRGHRLVADDAIDIRLIEGELVGEAPEISRHLIEVRGLGIVNARELFGAAAVRDSKRLDLAVRLVHFDRTAEAGRLGRGERCWPVLGRELPLVRLPVGPGRNVAVLLEIAARQELLRQRGQDAGRDLEEELARRLARGGDGR